MNNNNEIPILTVRDLLMIDKIDQPYILNYYYIYCKPSVMQS